MKKLLLALVCVGFASASVFAADCCGPKKDDKTKEAPAPSAPAKP